MWGAILGAGISLLGGGGDNGSAENARIAREQGIARAKKVRRDGRQSEGALMVGIGASGFSSESKSALSAIAQNTKNVELDAEMALTNANAKASSIISQGRAASRANTFNTFASAARILL